MLSLYVRCNSALCKLLKHCIVASPVRCKKAMDSEPLELSIAELGKFLFRTPYSGIRGWVKLVVKKFR